MDENGELKFQICQWSHSTHIQLLDLLHDVLVGILGNAVDGGKKNVVARLVSESNMKLVVQVGYGRQLDHML